ncbi:MAG: trpD, partial [Hyphomicrobiales bacterium]|nr:trpD [Hyphomicrobiales bacterium]
YGSDGLDELTTTGPTHVVMLDGAEISSFTITPEDAGLPLAKPDDLKGGDPEFNARALRAVLAGEKSPYRDIALLNAAAALVVAGGAKDLREGVTLGARALDGGAAKKTLDTLVTVSNRG